MGWPRLTLYFFLSYKHVKITSFCFFKRSTGFDQAFQGLIEMCFNPIFWPDHTRSILPLFLLKPSLGLYIYHSTSGFLKPSFVVSFLSNHILPYVFFLVYCGYCFFLKKCMFTSVANFFISFYQNKIDFFNFVGGMI